MDTTSIACFNPRPRMGGDYFNPVVEDWTEVSIHAPAWGATLVETKQQNSMLVSIHAPAWGATDHDILCKILQRFQSTPPHGGRLLGTEVAGVDGTGFNPRPRMGGDIIKILATPFFPCFNPRPRMGGDLPISR